MSLMPLFAVVVVLTLGYLAIVRYPGLQGSAADQVMALILRDTLAFGWQGVAIVTVMLAAILAALMSTADSALLSFSSIFAKDIYGSLIDPSSPEERLTRIGQRCAWLVLAAMVFTSTREDVTLYRLFVLKFELLLQVAPAFYLGVTNRHIAGKAVYWGLIVGLVVAVMGWLLGVMPLGLHPGTLGLAVNVLVIATWHMIRGINAPSGS
jgi:SSS family solute:Na+ symporter/sodium/pantothenate symporter